MLEQYEATLEQWMGSVVNHGDDDALFACGYLQGHVAVVFSQLEAEGDASLPVLDSKIADCMELAKTELEDGDFRLVESAWSDLRKHIEAL
ncbi:MAG: YfcL family protein [Parashewanella sp.]